MTYASTLGQLGQQTALVVPAGSLVRATGLLTAGAVSQQQLDRMIAASFATLMPKMGLRFVGARKTGTLRARRVVVEARLVQHMSSGQLTGTFTQLFTAATGAVGGTAAWSVTVSHPGLVRRQIGVPQPPGFPPIDPRGYQIPAAPGEGIPTWVWAVSAVAVLGVIAVVALSRPKRATAPPAAPAPAPVAANRRRRKRRR